MLCGVWGEYRPPVYGCEQVTLIFLPMILIMALPSISTTYKNPKNTMMNHTQDDREVAMKNNFHHQT